jgi:hypothetical protein
MQNKIHIWAVVGLILSTLGVTGQASEQQWLRYRSGRDVRQILGNIGSQQIELSEERPTGVGLPEFEASNPLFGQWTTPMVESGHIWISLDRSEKDGPYDRLFIDSNADGNLKDETVVTAYQKQWNRANFGPLKVLFKVENEPVAYHLNFEFIGYNNQNMFIATSGGWYEGQITVGQRRIHCTLIDQNANGTFNDTSDYAYECDRIMIGEKSEQQINFVGKEIVIGAVVYEPKIARDGSFLEITPAENVTYGKIRLPETIHQFAVMSDERLFTIKPDKGTGQLPVGKYRIQFWKTEHKDEQGNDWVLAGKDFGGQGDFVVGDSGQTDINIGEPITCEMQIRKRGSNYSFSQVLRGNLGEQIEMTCNGSRPEAPKLNIKNDTGSYDRTYRFEYG